MTKKCFDNKHMTIAQFGFLCLARSLSSQSGVLYFDGRKFGHNFAGGSANGRASRTPMYRMVRELTAMGWLEPLTESVRDAYGKFSPATFRVLTHDEWVAKHPGCCNLEVKVVTGITFGGTVEAPAVEPVESPIAKAIGVDVEHLDQQEQVRQGYLYDMNLILTGQGGSEPNPKHWLLQCFKLLATPEKREEFFYALSYEEQLSLEDTPIGDEMLSRDTVAAG